MTSHKLDTLPTEVLLDIVKLTTDQEHTNDLLDIKLTNKTLSIAAKEAAAHTIRISTKDGRKLETQAKRLLAQLTRDGNLAHVRRLVLKGYKGWFCSLNGELYPEKEFPGIPPMSKMDVDILTTSELEALTPSEAARAPWSHVEETISSCPATDIGKQSGGWTALAELISKLPRLEHVCCACVHQLPIQVLQAINQPRRPTCKLDISSFSLPYSNCPLLAEVQPQGYELALLSSPTLHNVGLTQFHDPWEAPGAGPLNYALTAQFLLAYAPNLKTLSLAHQYHWYYDETQRYRANDLLRTGTLPSPPQSQTLQHLRWSPHSVDAHESYGCLDLLSPVTSWQTLRTLDIPQFIGIKDLVKLTSLELPAVRSLRMYVMGSHLAIGSTVDQFEQCADMIRHWIATGLSHLTHLDLRGVLNSSLITGVVQAHGSTLRHLCLRRSVAHQFVYHSLRLEEIVELVQCCPELTDLRIPLARGGGDAKEVAAYETLGTLKELQRLILDLDIFPHARDIVRMKTKMDRNDIQTYTDYDAWDLEPFKETNIDWQDRHHITMYNGDVRRILQNAIVDEQLAGEIYHCLSRYRSSAYKPLQRVHLNIDTAPLMLLTGVVSSLRQRYILRVVRNWRITTGPYGDLKILMTKGPSKPPHRYLLAGIKRTPSHGPILEKIWNVDVNTMKDVSRLKGTQTQAIARAWRELPSTRLQMKPHDADHCAWA